MSAVDLRTLPAIRAEAERQSSALLESVRRHHGLMSDHTEGCVVEAHLDLLCDLTRPASRDAVARLVAAKLGWLFGALVNDLESGRAATLDALFRDIGVIAPSGITDPAEALRLIALHVLSEPT